MNVTVLSVPGSMVLRGLPANVLAQLERQIEHGPFHDGTLVIGMPAAGMAGDLGKTEHCFVSCVGVDQPGWIDISIAPMHHSIKRNELTKTINGIE